MRRAVLLVIALLASAVVALAIGIRLIVLDRLPDGTLSLGLAVALGTCGVVWLLIERRIAVGRRTAPVSTADLIAADQRNETFLVQARVAGYS